MATGSSKSAALRFWAMPNAAFATRKVLEREIREFQKSHPHINVELTIHPWFRAWDFLMDAAKGRQWVEAPDVMQIGTTWVSTLAFLGLLSSPEGDERTFGGDSFLRRSWDSCRIPGSSRIYAVPWFLDVRVLYYRRDILQEAGVSEKSLEDWEGFSAACRRLTELHRRKSSTPYPLSVSSQKPGVQVHDLAPWAWAAGGDFIDPVQNVSRLGAPETVEGLFFFYNLIAAGAVPLLGRDTVIPTGGFFRGDYAMQLCGVWPAGSALSPSHSDYRPDVVKNLGIAPFPIGPKGRCTFIGGSNLAVSTRCRHPEEAWELVRFLSTRESQRRHCLAISALPARMDGLDDVFAGHEKARSVFVGSLDFARALHSVVAMGSVERALWYFGERALKLILNSNFNLRSLRNEIETTDREINTVISFYSRGGAQRSS
jgi:multiple sugar transport system substrate-binding protein